VLEARTYRREDRRGEALREDLTGDLSNLRFAQATHQSPGEGEGVGGVALHASLVLLPGVNRCIDQTVPSDELPEDILADVSLPERAVGVKGRETWRAIDPLPEACCALTSQSGGQRFGEFHDSG